MRKKVIQLEKVNFILRMKEKARKKKDVFLNGRPKKRITKMRVFVHIE